MVALSSVGQGFVLLRDLWEYNSILKYRYKKLKSYKVAKMKHLPAPQAKEYKPNLAVRMVKYLYNSQVNLWKEVFTIGGSLFKNGDSTDEGWTRQEPRQIQQVDFKSWERKLGVTITYEYNSLGNFYRYVELKDTLLGEVFIERCQDVHISKVEDIIQLMYVKLAKNMADYTPPKQEVRERKLTHVRYVGGKYGGYFTQGKVYKVICVRDYKDGETYFDFESDEFGHPCTRHSVNGKIEGASDKDDFELIYDNEIPPNSKITVRMEERLAPLQITRSFKPYIELASMEDVNYENN